MRELVRIVGNDKALVIAKESFLEIFKEDAYKSFVLKKRDRKRQIIKQAFCFTLKKGYNISIASIARFLETKEETVASCINKFPENSRYANNTFADNLDDFHDMFELRIKEVISENPEKYFKMIDESIEKEKERLSSVQNELRKAHDARKRAYDSLELTRNRIEKIDMRIAKAEEGIERSKKNLNEKSISKKRMA